MKVHSFVIVLAYGIACKAVTPEDRTATPEDRPATPEDRPVTPEDRPATPEDRLQELETIIQAQYEDYVALKSRISELEGKVAGLKAEHTGEPQDPENLPQVDEQLKEHQSDGSTGHVSKRQSDPRVAFHAYMNYTKCYGAGNRFNFDVVPLDIGGGLTRDHSTYDVPAAGVYVLTWTVAVPQNHQKIVTELVVNSRVVVGVLTSDPDYSSYPFSGTGVHPSTGVVIVQLQLSDHVYINVKNASGSCGAGNVLGDDNIVRTTFSGWRLSELPQ